MLFGSCDNQCLSIVLQRICMCLVLGSCHETPQSQSELQNDIPKFPTSSSILLFLWLLLEQTFHPSTPQLSSLAAERVQVISHKETSFGHIHSVQDTWDWLDIPRIEACFQVKLISWDLDSWVPFAFLAMVDAVTFHNQRAIMQQYFNIGIRHIKNLQ